MAVIDCGSPVIDRDFSFGSPTTKIEKKGPVNANGIIDTVKVWAAVNITGFRAGLFFLVSGDIWECRDSMPSPGVSVPAGSEQTITGLYLHAKANDRIGCYFDSGELESSGSGGQGNLYVSAEAIDPGDQATYTLQVANEISLYGSGQSSLPISGGIAQII